MECHYCGRTADVVAETDGVRVGLCEDHFRERLTELSESSFEALQEELDIDRA
ncbi:MAG: DUF6757 family protein [Halodesulfurarchaeum sp.]|nr:DUF6757 family protein [Halodesulfurarchaeum sp.]